MKNTEDIAAEKPPRPTLRTVAAESGFAVTTVSRALSGDPRIAENTRNKVAEVARRQGYVPNRAAQRLRTGKTKVISLILDPHHEIPDFGRSLIAGISFALKGTGYHLTIIPHFQEESTTDPVNYILDNRLADGLIFTRTEAFDARVRLLQEANFPFVTHGRTDFTRPHAYVDYDNEEFAYQAARRLIDLGCDQIGIVLPPERLTFSQYLRYGFMRAVRESGIKYDIPEEVTLDSPAEALWAVYRDRLDSIARPYGVVCAGETSALAISSLFIDQGLEPGKDFHLVVKRTSNLFKLHRPVFRSIYENIFEAGTLLGDTILKVASGSPPAENQIVQKSVPD
ncbi:MULTISPECIES: LacI family DNA-binding transcriptional regulator [unclassified Roseibium]|uniref:LacI family DNA-binding transcriptional regulator n=1 Tax=unclassified Roseibium TaxID=2629323 RepID=UPI003177CD32